MRVLLLPLIALAAVVLASAAPPADPLERLRAGNAAFEREEYAAAVSSYRAAEELAIDPGLVAFNEGVALYRLGQFREAERAFVCCLEDARGERRARACYNLGNVLVRLSQGQDAGRLDQAIASYETCLRETNLDPVLAEDVRHNLELARRLRAQARPRKDNPESDPNDQKPAPDPGRQQNRRTAAAPGGAEPGEEEGGKVVPGEAAGDKKGPHARQPRPGAGNLQPIPDEDELADVPPEDAREHLRRAAAKIRDERARQRHQALPVPSRNVRDW